MAKDVMDMTPEEWAAHRGRTTTKTPQTSSKPTGLLERLKGGVTARINEKTADFNQRISDPKGWREKQHKEKLEGDSRRIRELQLESKLARLEASKARSQASSRKYSPAPMGGSDAPPLFDMGMGGAGGGFDSGSLFDLGIGGGRGGRKDEVPLFDLGLGNSAPKKHKKKSNKKAKKNSGITIHINK